MVFLLYIAVIKQKIENNVGEKYIRLLSACRELFQIQTESSQVENILEQTV